MLRLAVSKQRFQQWVCEDARVEYALEAMERLFTASEFK
jgi:hypothetical protein